MSYHSGHHVFRLGRSILIILSLGLIPALFAQEQMGKGRISGVVVDENGQPLEKVLIVVESRKTKTKLEGYSDKKGHFAVAGMGTGFWRITASKQGYSNSFVDMKVQQLTINPPITFTLKKITGLAALLTDETSMKFFDQGNDLIDQGQYDEALKIFEDFLAKYPEIFQAHLNVGTCYFKKGDLDKAEAEYSFVLEKIKETLGDYTKDKSTAVRAFSGLGEVNLKRGDLEAAQKCFSQALEVSPEDEAAAYNIGEIYFSGQKIDEAIRFLELATQIKKDWPKPYLKLGYVYLNKGDFSKSLENFNKFVELDPENPEVPQVKNIIATIEKMKK